MFVFLTAGSALLKTILLYVLDALGAGSSTTTCIEQVQQRFSEFTSGWKLCAELCQLLSCSLTVYEELVLDGYDVSASVDSVCALPVTDDGTGSVVSVRTSHSVTSSKNLVATGGPKRMHYQSAIAKDVIQENDDSARYQKLKLKTLDEHRYATRFQEKRVTPKTWKTALCEAFVLIQSGDRVNLAEALYLLLEIIWLDPRGCNLASMYLNAGSIYLEFDHLEEAVKAYRNCVRLDPANWKARYDLGIALARVQDFVEATRQLKFALRICPEQIAVEIVTVFEEIDRLQFSKNLRAFNAAKSARVFTTQYLESFHFTRGTCRSLKIPSVLALQEDHTLSHRNGFPLDSNSPQVLEVSHGWQGSMASLLHRLHAFALCRHVSVQDALHQLNLTKSGGMSTKEFFEVVKFITGVPLRAAESAELKSMFGNEGYVISMIFPYLTPNTESASAFEEMQTLGVCYTLLDLELFRKRAQRSSNSRAGGLWYWFDISMVKWIKQSLPQRNQTSAHGYTEVAVSEILAVHGWVTPMDFVWKWKRMPKPDDLPMLQLADRGTLIYECHHTRTCIQNEARCTIQMFARRLLIKGKREINTMHDSRQNCRGSHSKEFHLATRSHRLAADTSLDQRITREVLHCIEDIVDNLVAGLRQEQKSYQDAISWQDIPVRTEQRQKINSAVGVAQR
ncbi:unnamed protein product [Phytophthora fragariaefolia]|uniref:Unnamed protein product n=1 Tax=Phytophthora fragariaefolia TaxID=1490495 RepID=A0A9W6Y3I3_9STRA|nr:unnamed protein product [Phytophthora fragariaefolia]